MIENLDPKQSWQLLQDNPDAVLIDVRTKMEHNYIGRPPGAIHVPWKEFPDWQVNSEFVAEVKKFAKGESVPILLLCRSGQRSMDAAIALQTSGYKILINITEGFEGPLDENKHRGNKGGWRFHGLPWEQN